MQYTRKQIIDHLRFKHTATIPELSQILNLTIGNIRHHVRELQEQNIIEEVGNLPVKGRGRPVKLYQLSENAVDHNLDYLASILLNTILQDASPEETKMIIKQVADKIDGDEQKQQSPIQRIIQAISWLNQHNYQSRWEASTTGPRLFFSHCPYLAIITDHPELCQLDTAILSRLIRIPMKQVEKLERNIHGSRQCVFTVDV